MLHLRHIFDKKRGQNTSKRLKKENESRSFQFSTAAERSRLDRQWVGRSSNNAFSKFSFLRDEGLFSYSFPSKIDNQQQIVKGYFSSPRSINLGVFIPGDYYWTIGHWLHVRARVQNHPSNLPQMRGCTTTLRIYPKWEGAQPPVEFTKSSVEKFILFSKIISKNDRDVSGEGRTPW